MPSQTMVSYLKDLSRKTANIQNCCREEIIRFKLIQEVMDTEILQEFIGMTCSLRAEAVAQMYDQLEEVCFVHPWDQDHRFDPSPGTSNVVPDHSLPDTQRP